MIKGCRECLNLCPSMQSVNITPDAASFFIFFILGAIMVIDPYMISYTSLDWCIQALKGIFLLSPEV